MPGEGRPGCYDPGLLVPNGTRRIDAASNLAGILFALGWTRIPGPVEREIEHAAHRAERARDELDALLHQRDAA